MLTDYSAAKASQKCGKKQVSQASPGLSLEAVFPDIASAIANHRICIPATHVSLYAVAVPMPAKTVVNTVYVASVCDEQLSHPRLPPSQLPQHPVGKMPLSQLFLGLPAVSFSCFCALPKLSVSRAPGSCLKASFASPACLNNRCPTA